MKNLFVSDLSKMEEGVLFDSFFLVEDRQQRMTRQNAPFVVLTLGDKAGKIEARIWNLTDPRVTVGVKRGDIVKVRAAVNQYEGKLQLKIDQMRVATPNETSKEDFLPSTTCNVQDLWNALQIFVDSFANEWLKTLLKAILDDPATGARLREAPAARTIHHAWLGGLLEHVVSLLNLAESVAQHYPSLDRDLLLTGVILHDLGKTQELSWDLGFDYTAEGVLLGHIQIGASMAEHAIEKIPGFPPKLRALVLHMILAHHGKLEYGSPKVPMIAEALILSFVDDLDAKMMAMANEFDKATREGKTGEEFTGKCWALDNRQLLNTKLFLQDPAPAAVPTEEAVTVV